VELIPIRGCLRHILSDLGRLDRAISPSISTRPWSPLASSQTFDRSHVAYAIKVGQYSRVAISSPGNFLKKRRTSIAAGAADDVYVPQRLSRAALGYRRATLRLGPFFLCNLTAATESRRPSAFPPKRRCQSIRAQRVLSAVCRWRRCAHATLHSLWRSFAELSARRTTVFHRRSRPVAESLVAAFIQRADPFSGALTSLDVDPHVRT